MATVRIWGSLSAATEGRSEIDIDAATTRELLDKLVALYPGLKPQVERGVSVAIDGTIYKEAWFTPIGPDSEVVLLPYMAGG